jgi:hypothetical protein
VCCVRYILVFQAPTVNNASTDLLGLSTPPASQPAAPSNTGVLLDMFGDIYSGSQNAANNINNLAPAQSTYNAKK